VLIAQIIKNDVKVVDELNKEQIQKHKGDIRNGYRISRSGRSKKR
jgi:hypothetical protein